MKEKMTKERRKNRAKKTREIKTFAQAWTVILMEIGIDYQGYMSRISEHRGVRCNCVTDKLLDFVEDVP